ncbi:glycoside hydrolase family 127 protein [Lapidilactobacillus gannanensis]|uniref:Glycoside hydrolase family 127 protein n=1 Tax=Lapidilactobacillus gannanensis TaxID=2486002 RepID=A0ABW4BJB2_9LACO|nr:beta-L-arabinofuranosidase domain-containing protein [Lapidilactobacillus gannanensis]
MKQPKIQITDSFWSKYRQIVKDVMIPYQWSVINDDVKIDIERENANAFRASEKSHAIQNLKIAAGLAKGDFYGFWFQDSDVYKWLEAVAYALRYAPDQALQQTADGVVALISQAQEDDGYLDTFFQIRAPQLKFQHVSFSHELYCMGHYIEAGVAYYETTRNQLALTIATKMADCIDAHFGPAANKMHGYPGHPELELALAKLADLTNETRYSNLAAYMINQRGTKPNFFAEQAANNEPLPADFPFGEPDDNGQKYFQNHVPVRELKAAEGHAVRMTYLLTGMAHVARQTNDASLQAACQRLWKNIVDKQMYLTGGIGATVAGEAFTFDYDLPNDTMYCETCASCAMVFFAKQMLENNPDGEYADVMERELFNGTISGMALDGQHFFYVNPLAVNPEASALDPNKSHVKITRPAWFGCACCPPNLARLIASLDQYLYTVKSDTIYSNQFIAHQAKFGNDIQVEQVGHYPWSGTINYTIKTQNDPEFTFAIRVPNWSQASYTVKINGQPQKIALDRGYLKFMGPWSASTTIELVLDMSVRTTQANPLVSADLGKVAIERGPLVYCLEQADNGAHLPELSLAAEATFEVKNNHDLGLPMKLTTVSTTGAKLTAIDSEQLYQSAATARATIPAELTFIPYFAWANRQPGEMQVWTRQQ